MDNSFIKDPDANKDYGFDWIAENWLNDGETITASAWTITPSGLTKGTEESSNSITKVWLSGGTVGVTYAVTNKITTSDGRIEEKTLYITIEESYKLIPVGLNINALIDITYFELFWDGETLDTDRIANLINAVSSAFELFCSRKLRERTYTYVEGDQNLTNGICYVPEYCIFDGIKGNHFYFPTYPVSLITSFSISGIAITEAAVTEYTLTDYYKLYKSRGLLKYDGGFDCGYYQNILTVWKGGYSSTSSEMEHLKYLCFLAMKDFLNAPENNQMQSERIGDYQYSLMPSTLLVRLQGYSPKVFKDLSYYKKGVFA